MHQEVLNPGQSEDLDQSSTELPLTQAGTGEQDEPTDLSHLGIDELILYVRTQERLAPEQSQNLKVEDSAPEDPAAQKRREAAERFAELRQGYVDAANNLLPRSEDRRKIEEAIYEIERLKGYGQVPQILKDRLNVERGKEEPLFEVLKGAKKPFDEMAAANPELVEEIRNKLRTIGKEIRIRKKEQLDITMKLWTSQEDPQELQQRQAVLLEEIANLEQDPDWQAYELAFTLGKQGQLYSGALTEFRRNANYLDLIKHEGPYTLHL